MTTQTIPRVILNQHVAVLGKTGSGKTSTAKLAIEQVVSEGARVCVLDPIKSDWWGLTSSADGKRPGLPFHILGGPRGHVPLHSSAGKAVGEIVATAALPLSIIDMADFEPGGQAKFFVDFAPSLLRRMRGVVYLVIEEAHLFAPKERAGIGAENLSIHWAKTVATAGRSKGVRLVLVTQRTQALHNALLGSCDTLIAHRLTAPADQDPAVKWLKANTSKDVLDQVGSSIASLKTGHGWICSGEAKLFELRAFPRIATYDNTATPTADSDVQQVKTAPVDHDKLRAIIGDAVKEAEANDPKALRRQLADVRRELQQAQQGSLSTQQASPAVQPHEVLTDADRALLQQLGEEFRAFSEDIATKADAILAGIAARAMAEIDATVQRWTDGVAKRRRLFLERLEKSRVQRVLDKIERVTPSAAPVDLTKPARAVAFPTTRAAAAPGDALPRGERAILVACAMYAEGVTRDQLGVLTGYKRSSRDSYIARLVGKGYLEPSANGHVQASAHGTQALGPDYAPLPTGPALLDWWRARLPEGERKTLDVLVEAYPQAVARADVDAATGYQRSSRDSYLARLSNRKLVTTVGRGEVRAVDQLFLEER